MRFLALFLFVLFIASCSDGSGSRATLGDKTNMKLEIISNYGGKTTLITNQATTDIVRDTMRKLDWSGFHQVVLTKSNGDWLEVGGSLDPSDGLSVMYQENNEQVVIKSPPTSVKEMSSFLISYLSGEDDWKKNNEWHR